MMNRKMNECGEIVYKLEDFRIVGPGNMIMFRGNNLEDEWTALKSGSCDGCKLQQACKLFDGKFTWTTIDKT